MRVFKIPHVICMANFQPNREALSRDQWLTMDLDSINEHRIQAQLPLTHNMDRAVPPVNEEMADEQEDILDSITY